MKKFATFFVLSIVLTTSAFSQEKANAVSIDVKYTVLSILLGGVGTSIVYERAINDYFSVIGNINYWGVVIGSTLNTDFYEGTELTYLEVGARFRIYAGGNALTGIFIDGGCKYSNITKEYIGQANYNVINLGGRIGWKSEKTFFVESSLGFGVNFGDKEILDTSNAWVLVDGLEFNVFCGWTF
jgi:hypothetical protein